MKAFDYRKNIGRLEMKIDLTKCYVRQAILVECNFTTLLV